MSRADDEATQLACGAATLGVALDPRSASLLIRFLDQLYAWNRSAGLTTIARDQAVRLHLLDSLAIVPFLPAQGSLVDLGAGGGLPGIPVAVVLPHATITLVETRRRKASFLAEVIRELGLGNCRVKRVDAHLLAAEGELYDAVMSRAFLAPGELVNAGVELVGIGGRIVIMGARGDLKIQQAEGRGDLACTADECFTLPGGEERRRVVVFRKLAAHH